MATIADLLKTQYEQQERLLGSLPEDARERKELAWRLATQLMDEVFEYLNASGYKLLTPNLLSRTSRILELVDTLKYLLSLCWIEQVTSEELESLFFSKTEAVYRRHEDFEVSSQICGFDIDGVLSQWLQINGVDYYSLTDEQRDGGWESGGILELEPVPGAREVLEQLKSQGKTIVLITARKIWLYGRVEHETHQWLKKHGMLYDRLFFGADKVETLKRAKLPPLEFFVEDDPRHALDMARAKIPTVLIGHPEIRHEQINNVESIREVSSLYG